MNTETSELKEEQIDNNKDNSDLALPNKDADMTMDDEVYMHNRCCEDCRERGCGRLYVADGCWKIHYPICIFTTTSDMRGLDQFLPNVCTRASANGKAFCIEHSAVLDRSGIPILLRPFLKFCGANPDHYSREDKKIVEAKLIEICKPRDLGSVSIPHVQGTSSLYDNLGIQV